MKVPQKLISLFFSVLLLVMFFSCNKVQKSDSYIQSTNSNNLVTDKNVPINSINSSALSGQVNLTLDDEIKWMNFCTDAFAFQEFTRDSELNEKKLIDDMAFYLLFKYHEPDREQFVTMKGMSYLIKQEGIDMLSEKFFGRKVKKHQSIGGYDYKDGIYYPWGTDNHGHPVTHIQDFKDNKDGIYTIEYDYYRVNEDDTDSILVKLKPEEFIYEIHKEPQKFPRTFAKGKLTLQKVIKDSKERYIIIENVKTVL